MSSIVEEVGRLIDAYIARHGPGFRRLPTKAPDYDVEDGGVPQDMEDGPIDDNGWVTWRALPSRVDLVELEALESKIGPLPPYFRAFVRARCHLFDTFWYEGHNVNLPHAPSDDPLGRVTAILESWDELARAGYVTIGGYADGAGPLCIDRRQRTEDDDFAVVWFDHDALNRLSDHSISDRAVVEPLATFVAPSCRALLIGCLSV